MHELLSIFEVILNIISFYVWLIIVMPFVLLLLAIPAVSIHISNAIRDAREEGQEAITHGVRRFHIHEDEVFVEDISEIPASEEKDDDYLYSNGYVYVSGMEWMLLCLHPMYMCVHWCVKSMFVLFGKY